MNLPTIRQLECLVAVAENLNFRRAAESCFITQPALSAQVQQLEGLLGVELFERDRRRVLSTAAGVELADKARRILTQIRELGEVARGHGGPLSGTLRLGVIPTVAPYLLPAALGVVHRRFPALRLLLREDQTSELVRRLDQGELDVLLLALEANLGGAETRALFTDRFWLAVPSGHRLATRKTATERDLEDEDVLLLEDGHCLRDQALSLCQQIGIRELDDFRASSLTTLVQMVSSGNGVTLLPEMSLRVEATPARKLSLLRFRKSRPARTIGLAWRPSSSRKADFRALGEAITSGSRVG